MSLRVSANHTAPLPLGTSRKPAKPERPPPHTLRASAVAAL
jgi:hypothetical protein